MVSHVVFPDALYRLFYAHVFLKKKLSVLMAVFTRASSVARLSYSRYGYHDLRLLVSIRLRINFFVPFVSTVYLSFFEVSRLYKPQISAYRIDTLDQLL